MVKLNKRGWLRIFEAVIAILLIMGSILIIYQNQREEVEENKYIGDWQEEILIMLSENDSLRNSIVKEEADVIKRVIKENLPSNLNFTIKICNLTEHCPLDFFLEKDIFVKERIISGTIEEYNPKRVRFFIWKIEG